MANQVECVFLCVESHRDRGIVAGFHSEEKAEEFCKQPENLTDTGYPKYYVVTIWMDDFVRPE